MYVMRHGGQKTSLVHKQTAEAGLKQVAMTFVAVIVGNGEGREKAAHELGKTGLFRAFDKQMKMVGDEAPGMDAETEQHGIPGHPLEESFAVLMVCEGQFPGAGPGMDVIKRKRQVYAV